MRRSLVYLRQLGIVLGAGLALVGLSVVLVRSCSAVSTSISAPLQHASEASLRELTLKQLSLDPRFQVIDNAAAEKVLNDIAARLTSRIKPELDWPIRIKLVKNSDANAMTLPGGEILVFTGLLKDATKAEEVAAVLAHELGHVKYQDPFHALERSIAISVLLSAGTGGASPQTMDQIVQILTESAFSRSVEARADRFALELLASCKIRPGHLADFFRTLTKTPLEKAAGKQLSWIGSHPDTDSRIQAADAAEAAFGGPEEGLGIDWAAFQELL